MADIIELKPINKVQNIINKFCYTIGMLPTSYKASMTYEEQLVAIGQYLEETVIPALNNNAEVVAELQNLYVELKNYVDNYFDNLNVQEEINNKLDEMSKNGELTQLIKNYVDPYISEQNIKINNIDSKVNSALSGAPTPVSSTAEMTDTSKIYLNTTDGKWYFYNGSSWIAGGVYQATEIEDNSIDVSKLNVAKTGSIFYSSINVNKLADNKIQIKTNNYCYLICNNRYYNVSNKDVTVSIPDLDIDFLVYDINNSNFNILTQSQLNTADNKSNYIIFAVYFNNMIMPLFSQSNFYSSGFLNYSNQIFFTKTPYSTITIDKNNHTITFNNLYISSKKALVFAINNVVVNYDPSINISYIIFEESTLKAVSFLDNFDYSRVVGYISDYGNFIFVKDCEDLLNKNNINDKNYITINNMTTDLFNKNKNTKVVFLGDSITQGMGGTNFAQNGETIITVGDNTWKRNNNGYCYANLLKDYLEDNYNCNVINNACSGTDSYFIKNNLETLLPTDTDFCLLMIGTNDELYDYNQVYNDLQTNINYFINYCNENNIKYVICSPVPRENNDNTDIKSPIFEINNIYKIIASQNNIEYVNMYNLIYYYCFENNKNWSDYLTSDNIHPNDKGYWLIFYMLLKGLGIAPSYENLPEPN